MEVEKLIMQILERFNRRGRTVLLKFNADKPPSPDADRSGSDDLTTSEGTGRVKKKA